MHQFGTRIPHFVLAAIRKEIKRLEDLAVALDAVCTCPFPLDRFLAGSQPDAPILEDWRLALRPVKCLVGRSTGHPRLPGERRPIVTSEIFLISEEFGWARSYSRWYRLGRPFNDHSKDS
jgi:hypothetical protein